jgi:hypothetical protein
MKGRTAILAILALVVCWYFATYFLATVGVRLQHSDFYPLWNGGSAILHGENPYGNEVTVQNQIAAYGTTAEAIGEKNEQRFAYPVYATFPILPLALLSFPPANRIAFFLIAALVVLSVGWIRGKWDATTALYAILAFASYPLVFALQIRQPTLLFFGFAVASFALLQSGRLLSAGVVAAISTGKPQLAFGFILPMLIWTLADWHGRKQFVLSFGAAMVALLGLSEVVSPHWIPRWVASMQAYARYHQSPSTIIYILGDKVGVGVSSLLLLGLMASLWLRRGSSLLFKVSLSTVIIYLLLPQQAYGAIILLIPTIWVVDQAAAIKETGTAHQLVLAAVRLSLIELWLANLVAALCLHGSTHMKTVAWWLPLNATFPLLVSLVVLMIMQLSSMKQELNQIPRDRSRYGAVATLN